MNISPSGNLGNGYQNQYIDQSSSESDERKLTTNKVAQQLIHRKKLSHMSKETSLRSPLDYLMKGNDEASMNFLYSFDRDITAEDLMLEFQRLMNKKDGGYRIRLFDQLLLWVRIRPSDFKGKGMVSSALSLISKSIDLQRANKLKLLLLRRVKLSPSLTFSADKPVSVMNGYQYVAASIKYMEKEIGVISDELTAATGHIYLCMTPVELTQPKLAKCAPILSKRFNHLSFWLVSMILLAENRKEQLFIVKKTICLAKHLHDRGNFQDAAAVAAALSNNDISRLLYLWNDLNKKEAEIWNSLDQFFSALDNYKSYRAELDCTKKELILPYLPVHLRDMTTISEIKQKDVSIVGGVVGNYLKYQCKWQLERASVNPADGELTTYFLSEEDRNSLSDKWKESNGSYKKRRDSVTVLKRKQVSVPDPKSMDSLKKNRNLSVEIRDLLGGNNLKVPDQMDNLVRVAKSVSMSEARFPAPFRFKISCEQTDKAMASEMITRHKNVEGFNLIAITTCVKRNHSENCSCKFVSKNLKSVIETRLEKNNPISALKLSFDDLEKLIIKNKLGKTGCGLSVLMFKQEKSFLHIYTANVGDSPIACFDGKSSKVLSESHRGTNEKESKRIKKQGGSIIRGKVSSILDVTRCLGIINGKKYLSNIPHLNEVKVNISEDTRLLMGSYRVMEGVQDQNLSKSCTSLLKGTGNEGSLITIDCKEMKDD